MKGNEIRKGLTQKEMAKKFNLSLSTVKKYTSQPRNEYESEAENRRKTAYLLHHENGLKWREVAEKMNTTENAVKALAKRYKQIDQDARG
ncbi:sigma-70 region 4 domain-containing protein [Escherichia coli]|nr:plasmid replication protein [Salmonella enterica subsp. enterica]